MNTIREIVVILVISTFVGLALLLILSLGRL